MLRYKSVANLHKNVIWVNPETEGEVLKIGKEIAGKSGFMSKGKTITFLANFYNRYKKLINNKKGNDQNI